MDDTKLSIICAMLSLQHLLKAMKLSQVLNNHTRSCKKLNTYCLMASGHALAITKDLCDYSLLILGALVF